MSKKTRCIGALVVIVGLAGCGSSKTATGGGNSSGVTSPSGGSSGGPTYTIGVLTDETGLAASGNKTSVQGVEAGIAQAAKDGYHFKYVVGDTETSPAGALSAAKLLVDQDHVNAVIAVGSLTFAAAPYLTQQDIPVVGTTIDGSEWLTSKNMFSVFGYLDETKVSTGGGQLLKMLGATTIGTVGYGISPTSAESAKGIAASAQAAGLKVPYLNAQFPFGSTNVQPVALAMKSAGVDGIYAATDPNSAFALLTGLRQEGINPKAALFADGYGGDLTGAGPSAAQQAKGATFSVTYEPVEMNTPATKQFVANLKTAGVSSEPTVAEYEGYASVAGLEAGLKISGPSPSKTALIAALSQVKGFDAYGLLGSHTLDLNDRLGSPAGPGGCSYYATWSGSAFMLIPGAEPLCGTVIPGKTVSAS